MLKHFAKAHNNAGMRLCALCVEHRQLFMHEQRIYTDREYAIHMDASLPEDSSCKGIGGGGHPRCLFCQQSFYDSYHFHNHMRSEHITCHLCNADKQHRFYEHMEALSDHIRSAHLLCAYCEENGELAGFNDHNDFAEHLQTCHNMHAVDLNKILINITKYSSNRNRHVDNFYDMGNMSAQTWAASSNPHRHANTHANTRAHTNTRAHGGSMSTSASAAAVPLFPCDDVGEGVEGVERVGEGTSDCLHGLDVIDVIDEMIDVI